MKSKIITKVALFLAAFWLIGSCETDLKKSEDKYTADQVVPVVQGVTGSTLALQTFKYIYNVTYYRAGSTWTWTAVDAKVDSVSPDKRTARILYDKLPATDTALVKVTETTSAGTTSDPYVVKVRVNPFCPLALSGFVGTWSGTDGGGGGYMYPTTSVTTSVSGTKLLVGGINVGFMGDFWGENIVAGGTFLMTVGNDGTLAIPEQYFCDTDLSSGYKIKGSGTWDNCGAKPKMIINYDIWYPDSNYWIAAHYKSYLGGIDHLTATLTMQ